MPDIGTLQQVQKERKKSQVKPPPKKPDVSFADPHDGDHSSSIQRRPTAYAPPILDDDDDDESKGKKASPKAKHGKEKIEVPLEIEEHKTKSTKNKGAIETKNVSNIQKKASSNPKTNLQGDSKPKNMNGLTENRPSLKPGSKSENEPSSSGLQNVGKMENKLGLVPKANPPPVRKKPSTTQGNIGFISNTAKNNPATRRSLVPSTASQPKYNPNLIAKLLKEDRKLIKSLPEAERKSDDLKAPPKSELNAVSQTDFFAPNVKRKSVKRKANKSKETGSVHFTDSSEDHVSQIKRRKTGFIFSRRPVEDSQEDESKNKSSKGTEKSDGKNSKITKSQKPTGHWTLGQSTPQKSKEKNMPVPLKGHESLISLNTIQSDTVKIFQTSSGSRPPVMPLKKTSISEDDQVIVTNYTDYRKVSEDISINSHENRHDPLMDLQSFRTQSILKSQSSRNLSLSMSVKFDKDVEEKSKEKNIHFEQKRKKFDSSEFTLSKQKKTNLLVL